MSNYLVVVHDASATGPLNSWLDANGSPESERFAAPLNRRRQLTIVSKDVSQSVSGSTYFRGTGVSPENNAIIFGAAGWSKLRRAVDEHGVAGEFVMATWDRRAVRVRRDVFSSVGMMHAHGPGFIAVSDSLLILADLRSHFGLRNAQNDEAIMGRSVLNAHAGQQMSPETFVREIEWVPAGQGVTIDVRSTAVLRVDGRTMTDRVIGWQADRTQTLRNAAAFIASGTEALASIDDWETELSLSGGYDSRIILAGALRNRAVDGMVVVSANRVAAHEADFAVAKSLAGRFDFRLNPSRDRGKVVDYGMNPVGIWASTSLGTYDRLMPVTSRRTAERETSLTGIGAEILKGNWGWTSLRGIVDGIDLVADRRDAFEAQLRKGMAAVGADPEWADASELQYIGYRNGIHGAGHIAMHMNGVRLLQQVAIAALGHVRSDGADALEHRSRASFGDRLGGITDMLAVMNTDLAGMPYDDSRKNLDPDHLAARRSALGGPLGADEGGTVEIFGHPQDVPAGPSVLGESVARRRGFAIDRDPQSLLTAIDAGVEALNDSAVRAVYEEVAAHARWRMMTKGLPPEDAGFSTPKALSLLLFAS